MDVAYDHIQEEVLSPDDEAAHQQQQQQQQQQQPSSLNTEFQEAFKAVSASPWGAKLGGFFGQVKKQSETLYSDAQKEYVAAQEQASRGFTGLLNHTRNLSIAVPEATATATPTSFSDPTFTLPEQPPSSNSTKEAQSSTGASQNIQRPDSLPADIVKEATSIVSRFRSEAPALLSRIQKAEDAADEALLKFGSNIRNFLRDAVTVTGPEGETSKDGETAEVLFETNDSEGKRVFHSSRFDAQLHVIHTTPTSFTQDPQSDEYAEFESQFDIEKQTDAIAQDLDKYEELRRAMEKLVPELVNYATFWRRYYFLRKVIEAEEKRRKEVLKGVAADTGEELGWGSDEEEEEEEEESSITPNASTTLTSLPPTEEASTPRPAPKQATTSLAAGQPQQQKHLLKPTASPRRSEDGKSTAADSDASYDIVSGTTSRAAGSPKDEKKAVAGAVKEEESDEEDWE